MHASIDETKHGSERMLAMRDPQCFAKLTWHCCRVQPSIDKVKQEISSMVDSIKQQHPNTLINVAFICYR